MGPQNHLPPATARYDSRPKSPGGFSLGLEFMDEALGFRVSQPPLEGQKTELFKDL